MSKGHPTIAIIVILLCLPFICLAQEPDGRQIMETQLERHRVKSARDHVVMLLINKNNDKKIRELKRYGKTSDDGLKRTMIVFTSPADLKGTTLMTREISKDSYNQWIYLPGQTSMHRIADNSKQTPFMGSDFTYEDMRPENPDHYAFTLSESQMLDGQDCFVIDITPRAPEAKKTSSYGRRRAWVRKDIFFTLKIEFYDKRDRLIKTQTSHGLKNLKGDVWYAEKVLMENHKKHHKTLLGVKTKETDIPISDAFFTEKTILSKKHLSQ